MTEDSALDQLPDEHGQLRLFLESAHSSVVAADEQGLITYVNARTVATFGYQPEELVGRPGAEFLPAPLSDEEQARQDDYLSHPYRVDLKPTTELRIVAKDGRQVPVEIRLTPLEVAGGVWTVAGITDLTARVAAEERSRTFGRAYRTLAQMNQAIVRAPDAETLFQETCQIAVELGGYLGAFVGAVGDDGRVRPLTLAGGIGGYIARLGITLDPDDPRGQGPTARALRENTPCFSVDFVQDSRTLPWHDLAREYGVRSLASLPLRVSGQPVAVLNLYSGADAPFDAEIGELYEHVADNVSYALDRFAADERLARVAGQRNDLLKRLATAEETERARIAADLHDDSVQALAAIELRLGMVRRKLEARDAAADLSELLDPIQDGLVAASAGLRSLLFELEPPAATESCATALRHAAEYVFDGDPIQWQVKCDDDVHLVDTQNAQALRIVKEALINVRKHARATRVDVHATSTASGIEVAVTDDGVGFAPEVDLDDLRSRPGHRGLATMRDRATVTGGWLRVERAPGSGTVLRFFIPRNAPA